MLTRTLHSSTTKSAENTVAGLQQAPLVVRAHADAGAAVGCTTSGITRLWVAEVLDLTQDGREEGEGCTSGEDTLAHCLAGEGLAVEDAPIPGVVSVADWSRQQARLRDEEGPPVIKGDETCYWWTLEGEQQLILLGRWTSISGYAESMCWIPKSVWHMTYVHQNIV